MMLHKSVSLAGNGHAIAAGPSAGAAAPVIDAVLKSGDAALQGAWQQVSLWRARAAQRRELLALDAHGLRDIGLSREQAVLESRKPFWRA